MFTSKQPQNSFDPKQAVHFIYLLVVIFLLLNVPITDNAAQGNLLITPRRVVFDGSKKSQELNLANTGKDTAKYQISIVQIRMTEEGAFETITQPDSGQYFADSYLRFFPRSVTLAPNQAQTIKIQLVKTSQLTPGEYRSHLYFRAIPNIKPLGENELRKDSTAFSIQLTPIFGITIPVIIRVGEPVVDFSLSNVRFTMANDTIPRIQVSINRTGNMSVYGDLEVNYVSPEGVTTQVGIARGIAVYTPNPRRKFRLDINKIPGINYKTGKFHLIFSAQPDAKPSQKVETEIQLH
jgi:P pilus assembly chaperone PapD